MKKPTRTYPITLETLSNYQAAAVRNAAALMKEADVLYKVGHYARTYYLAEAAIEETGKAAIAHFAKSRNLGTVYIRPW
jgi:AbiV family abortive infection protein